MYNAIYVLNTKYEYIYIWKYILLKHLSTADGGNIIKLYYLIVAVRLDPEDARSSGAPYLDPRIDQGQWTTRETDEFF